MENTNIFPNLSTLGGTSFVNFPEHIPVEMNAVFVQACNYRINLLEHLMGETIRKSGKGATIEETADLHLQALTALGEGNVRSEDFHAAFGHYYTPVNIASAQERITVYDKASEFAQFWDPATGVSDLQLYTYLYKSPSYTPYTPEETAAKLEKINEINYQREIKGLPPVIGNMDISEDTAVSFIHETSSEDTALDFAYEHAIIEVYELFRACQFEMLNKWEKKSLIWQSRETSTKPFYTHKDGENKTSIEDMFESNIIMLLRHHEAIEYADKKCGTNQATDILNDNVLAGFFEDAQIFLQFAFERDSKTPYIDVWNEYDERFYRTVSEREYKKYKEGLTRDCMRFDLEDMEPGQTLKTRAYSALFFNNLSDDGKESLDRHLNKEMARIASENNLAPPPPAAHFREKSLKYDIFM